MTAFIIPCLFALIGSMLTFFSGFGLGTLLVPVFAFFFPIDLAIAMTAVVHVLNNVFKLVLTGKHVNRNITLRFGLPAMVFAFLGASVLSVLSHSDPIWTYSVSEHTYAITPVKLTVGILLFIFSIAELFPKILDWQVSDKYIPLGGVLSGFIGGLSGHQGALRSAFLIRSSLSKEGFVATGAAIAVLIDISRITVYTSEQLNQLDSLNYPLLLACTLAAFAGAIAGNKLLKKITIHTLQQIVGILLLVFSLLLSAGII